MKKYLFLTGMIALSAMTMHAQESNKPESGAWMLEVGLAPFATQSIQLQEGEIKVTYLFSDNIGFRLGVGFQTNSASDDNGLGRDEWKRVSVRETELKFTPGLVRFFSGTEKMSPYIGAELILATTSNEATLEKDNYKAVMKNEGDLMNTYGAGVFSGFNYYFSRNLYVGAEINLAFKAQSLKNTVTTVTSSGSTETTEPDNKLKGSSFGTSCYPFIRLGWAF
ncbi:MAG: outer membrane beta-barrel protein [Prevotella sp.]|jgi:outer membrane protein W|nr:outer membrane beta-barrel protein [Prevotella sp.]